MATNDMSRAFGVTPSTRKAAIADAEMRATPLSGRHDLCVMVATFMPETLSDETDQIRPSALRVFARAKSSSIDVDAPKWDIRPVNLWFSFSSKVRDDAKPEEIEGVLERRKMAFQKSMAHFFNAMGTAKVNEMKDCWFSAVLVVNPERPDNYRASSFKSCK